MDYEYEYLDEINFSDIKAIANANRHICKLLKIVLMKGEAPCQKLIRIIREDFGRGDLIHAMKKKSDFLKTRGKLFFVCSYEFGGCSFQAIHTKTLCA